MDSATSISALLVRAHSAISRARTLSVRLQRDDTGDGASDSSALVPPAGAGTVHDLRAEDTSTPEQPRNGDAPSTSAVIQPHQEACMGCEGSVMQRLTALQDQQQSTLRQLMHLRMEQLRLRRQQLKALQCMLQAEAGRLGDLHPLQTLAAQQALRLLAVSLQDLHVLHTTMALDSCLEDAKTVTEVLSHADARAEEVSRIVRELLHVLREPTQDQDDARAADVSGATLEELSVLPTLVCAADSVLCGQSCMICLCAFEESETLRCLQCAHHCHAACLDEWLYIRASCPLCKLSMRAATE